MERTPRRNLPNVPVHVIVACLILLGLLGAVWGMKCSRDKKAVPATYEEEVEAVRQKYEPLRKAHDEVLRSQGVEAGRKYYDEHIARPSAAEINEVRRRHGKPPLPTE